MERQNTFGKTIAIDLFLGGAGAGVFLISYVMQVLDKYEALARVGAITGPILVVIGTVFLFADLGDKAKFLKLFNHPSSSWMSRGTWFITAFVLFGLVYALLVFWLPVWRATPLSKVIGIVAAILSVLTILYSGFFFGSIKRIPFWNTPALPLLFLISSLCTGIAMLLLIAPFTLVITGGTLSVLLIAAIFLILMEIIALWILLETSASGSVSAAESAQQLKRPPFIVTVIVFGLIIPLALLSYAAVAGSTFLIPAFSGILLLIGNLLFRYYFLVSGVRLPIYQH